VAVPTHVALRAVVAAAAERGLPVDGLRIVRDATNVLVHLEPAPVIARVPITLARLRNRAWFEQEVELAAFAVPRGLDDRRRRAGAQRGCAGRAASPDRSGYARLM
jgi:hypothetical protein